MATGLPKVGWGATIWLSTTHRVPAVVTAVDPATRTATLSRLILPANIKPIGRTSGGAPIYNVNCSPLSQYNHSGAETIQQSGRKGNWYAANGAQVTFSEAQFYLIGPLPGFGNV